MLTPLLIELLSPAARQLVPLIVGMVEEGESSLAITEALQARGAGVRRTDLLSFIRGVKDISESRSYLSSVRNDRRPDPARLPQPVTKTLREYSFQVELRGRDVETGELRSQFVTISTSELLSMGEMKARALEMVPDFEEGQLGSGHLVGMEEAEAIVQTGTQLT